MPDTPAEHVLGMITKLDMRDALPIHVRTLGWSSAEPCTSGHGFEFLLACLANSGRGRERGERRKGMRAGRGNIMAEERPARGAGSAGARDSGPRSESGG